MGFKKIDFAKHTFFVKPCFICIYQSWDRYDTDYGSGSCYAICDAEDEIYETWQEDKKEFPYCESPKRCTRKNIFSFNDNFDYKYMEYYYKNLNITEEYLGVNNWETNNPKIELASSIAHSIASFNARMRQYKNKIA